MKTKIICLTIYLVCFALVVTAGQSLRKKAYPPGKSSKASTNNWRTDTKNHRTSIRTNNVKLKAIFKVSEHEHDTSQTQIVKRIHVTIENQKNAPSGKENVSF